MMISLFDITNLVIVLLACSLSLIVPTLRTALWLSEEKSWPNIFLIALVLGLTSQGILGFFWNHYLLAGISLEITLYFLVWLIITVIVSLSQGRQPFPRKMPMNREDYF